MTQDILILNCVWQNHRNEKVISIEDTFLLQYLTSIQVSILFYSQKAKILRASNFTNIYLRLL